ncbi:putative kinesin [Pseudoneurospora amorphoporcata]|uniref:Kinesin n=1 Tax=Pseudoneurospora amorphoporcata TaxID=241081 RepID=A0AAN6NWK8_9PEZI|nr:putative kinesin [Pseudoneurospora amorphoporcata]
MAPGGAPMGGGGNIKVVVRCRPFNGREHDRGAKCIVEMKGNQTVLTPPPDAAAKGGKDQGQKVFAFDRSYWSFDKNAPNYAGQDQLHEDLGQPLLDNAFQGYNNCIFAYGQTGSGKSYSMMGYGKDAGIIPMICQDMFKRINEMQQDKNLRCTVEVSYLEIYNERVRDLLNPANKGNLKVREHPSTGPYVEDLAKLVVGSFQEIEHLMDEGNKARTVAATNMNETSSRSHAVFTLMLTQKRFDPETKMEMEKAAKISLVDLAGSERATSTGATGARLKEGAEINRSLSTLGRVIAALADLSTGKKKKGGAAGQVPYRDSVLTWLLKDSLGGNSMTAMIAAISPADINYDETLSTLRYADSAKRIKNHAVVNEDANARMIRELKEELAQLRSKLGGGGGGIGGAPVPGEEVYAEGTPLEKQIVSITTPDGTVKKVSKAEIAEQLNQSEKLLQDLNQTWEQKLQKTEEIHKEREAALEELGISIEKGFIGMSTPKKMPHLVNLSDDPLLAECLVYNLKPGSTSVGNVESNAEHQANIRLNGSRILHEHCVFENAADGTVTVVPKEGAAVMVNGKRVTEPTRLHSGYRIILGDFHIFRFNHPLEAKAERAERAEQQSLLRQSVTTNQLQALEKSPALSPSHNHHRSLSTAVSEGDNSSHPDSPAPFSRNTKEADWSFARREAAGAILGTDQNFAKLTDEELNALFEDVQRARAERVNVREGDEDMESMASYPIREKYMSTGTLDNLSLDTALTMPSTPKHGETEEKLGQIRDVMQSQLDKQKEEYKDQLKTAEGANVEVEEIKKEKAKMEETLMQLKVDMQKQLEIQKRQFEEKIEKLDPLKRPKANPKLSADEIERAKAVVKKWRSRRYVLMAEAVLQHAATLKEAQVMSHELNESVVFQFTIVDVGHLLCSSYDMVLNGLTGEGDDIALETAPKPCVGIRVVDYKHSVVHLWSIEKLHDRVRQMRQMFQYLDQPEYAQHLSLDNPFVETCMPQYTLVGEADVPLKTVFESRVQDFTLDVTSPHTSHAIGMIKLALEPSSARAPTNTLKFNVVMHEMIGFAEREGTEVHAQLFIPGISEEEGITTTQMIRDFDEGPIRFESVHSMSIPLFASQDTSLRVAIFAKVSAMHLDKLLSWDDMRDAVPTSQSKPKGARINETHFYTEEKHDLLVRVQILELNEEGDYVPVEVTQTSELDNGTFQLHQGLQRRVAITVTHSSGDALPWNDAKSLRLGKIALLDSAGKTPDMGSASPPLPLRLVSEPTFRVNANGTRSVTLIGQWDSSLHNSLLLDRVTSEKYRVQMTVSWEIDSEKLAEPIKMSLPVAVQIVSRNFVRQTSMFSSLWQNIRIVHSSTGIFTVQMRPAPIKRVSDLWRMSSQHDYVKGEENLGTWAPRGVSLVADYISAQKKKRMMTELTAVQGCLRKLGLGDPNDLSNWVNDAEDDSDLPPPKTSSETDSIAELLKDDPPEESEVPTSEGGLSPEEEEQSNDTEHIQPIPDATDPAEPPSEYTDAQTYLLNRCLKFWQRYPDPTVKILSPANTDPPTDGYADSTSDQNSTLEFVASVIRVPKNPSVLKGGYLLVPNSDATKWNKRFVELRRPYLHIHSVPDGEEVGIVSLRNSRVDSQPGILGLLNDDYGGGPGSDDGYRPLDNLNGVNMDNHRGATNGRSSGLLDAIMSGSGGGRTSNSNISTPTSQSQQRRSPSSLLISSLWPTFSPLPSPNPMTSIARSSNGRLASGGGGGGRTSAISLRSSTSSPASSTGTLATNGPSPPQQQGGGLRRLSERLQAGVFAIYGTDNTWLFAARSEKDKMDWIWKIDQSYMMTSPSQSVTGSRGGSRAGSARGSRAVSPSPGSGSGARRSGARVSQLRLS